MRQESSSPSHSDVTSSRYEPLVPAVSSKARTLSQPAAWSVPATRPVAGPPGHRDGVTTLSGMASHDMIS